MPVLENAIDDLVEEFDKALKYDYVISSPIVYALHQVRHRQ